MGQTMPERQTCHCLSHPSYSRSCGAGGMALCLQAECPLPLPTCGLSHGPTPISLVHSRSGLFLSSNNSRPCSFWNSHSLKQRNCPFEWPSICLFTGQGSPHSSLSWRYALATTAQWDGLDFFLCHPLVMASFFLSFFQNAFMLNVYV